MDGQNERKKRRNREEIRKLSNFEGWKVSQIECQLKTNQTDACKSYFVAEVIQVMAVTKPFIEHSGKLTSNLNPDSLIY